MATKAAIEDFVAQRKLAVVGVSRDEKKFGNMAYRELKSRGYTVFPINPNAEKIGEDPCYPTLNMLPEQVEAALIIVPPSEMEQVVRDAAAMGIRRIWMQQGSESAEALRFCAAQGINVVSGECILMFAAPVTSFHRVHRWVWGVLGKLPS